MAQSGGKIKKINLMILICQISEIIKGRRVEKILKKNELKVKWKKINRYAIKSVYYFHLKGL